MNSFIFGFPFYHPAMISQWEPMKQGNRHPRIGNQRTNPLSFTCVQCDGQDFVTDSVQSEEYEKSVLNIQVRVVWPFLCGLIFVCKETSIERLCVCMNEI
jgi:hypothetical protein